MMDGILDDTDKKIIEILLDNARISFSDLGQQLGISRVAAMKRVRILESNKVILGYQAIIDPSFQQEGRGESMKSKEIFEEFEELQKYKNSTVTLKFPIYMSKQLEETDIEALDLSVRSNNCLHRAGIHTIGELCQKIRGSNDLMHIRNCGRNSVKEIMDALFTYQYMVLSEKRRKDFLKYIEERN